MVARSANALAAARCKNVKRLSQFLENTMMYRNQQTANNCTICT